MFNCFLYTKKKSYEQKIFNQAARQDKRKAKYRKVNSVLSKRFRNKAKTENSVVQKSWIGNQRSFLQSQGYHTQNERLNEVVQKNGWLDTCPPKYPAFVLRPRIKSMEAPKQAKKRFASTIRQPPKFCEEGMLTPYDSIKLRWKLRLKSARFNVRNQDTLRLNPNMKPIV